MLKSSLQSKERAQLIEDKILYKKESEKFKDPLFKPWWKSYFSKNASKFFVHRDQLNFLIIIEIISIVLWSSILVHLYKSLQDAKTERFKYLFGLFASLPVISILIDTFTRLSETRFDPHLPPEYPACLTPTEKLSKELQNSGVIAKIDGKCFETQYEFLKNHTEVIRVKAYNSMYALFSLILVFFTVSNYTPFFKKDNPFIRESIRMASLLSLSLFTVTVLGIYYWYSLSILRFYGNMVQMNVSVILMLVGYLLYLITNRVLFK